MYLNLVANETGHHLNNEKHLFIGCHPWQVQNPFNLASNLIQTNSQYSTIYEQRCSSLLIVQNISSTLSEGVVDPPNENMKCMG